jgi:hypothetical protein
MPGHLELQMREVLRLPFHPDEAMTWRAARATVRGAGGRGQGSGGSGVVRGKDDVGKGLPRRLRRLDQAIADFAETCADQNERGYAVLRAAVKDGSAEAATEI